MINLTQDKLENLKEQSTESRTLNNKSVKSLNKVRPDANQESRAEGVAEYEQV